MLKCDLLQKCIVLILQGLGLGGAARMASEQSPALPHVRSQPAPAAPTVPVATAARAKPCLMLWCPWESRFRKGKNCCTTAPGREEWKTARNSPPVLLQPSLQPRKGPQRSRLLPCYPWVLHRADLQMQTWRSTRCSSGCGMKAAARGEPLQEQPRAVDEPGEGKKGERRGRKEFWCSRRSEEAAHCGWAGLNQSAPVG